jgi:hypothetical protein
MPAFAPTLTSAIAGPSPARRLPAKEQRRAGTAPSLPPEPSPCAAYRCEAGAADEVDIAKTPNAGEDKDLATILYCSALV